MTSRLDQLNQQMSELRNERARIIEECEERIQQANRRFDRLAVPLAREINSLTPKPPEQTPHKTPKAPNLTGLSEEEQAHYQELLNKSGDK